MSETPRPGPLADVHQKVSTNVGYAYGTIGADLLVFTDRGPVYHLADHVAPADPDPGSLRAQPSRMLDARLRMVDLGSAATRISNGWRSGETPRRVSPHGGSAGRAAAASRGWQRSSA